MHQKDSNGFIFHSKKVYQSQDRPKTISFLDGHKSAFAQGPTMRVRRLTSKTETEVGRGTGETTTHAVPQFLPFIQCRSSLERKTLLWS